MRLLRLLTGWKAYVAGACLIAVGIYEVHEGRGELGAARIAEGLGLIGLRHKLSRLGG